MDSLAPEDVAAGIAVGEASLGIESTFDKTGGIGGTGAGVSADVVGGVLAMVRGLAGSSPSGGWTGERGAIGVCATDIRAGEADDGKRGGTSSVARAF